MRRLTLYVPGLLGPDTAVHPDDLPLLPSLNWWLSKGVRRKHAGQSPSEGLCRLFGLTTNSLPIAAISRLAEDGRPPAGTWLRADPVSVSADQNGLVLFDQHRFRLSLSDARALAAEINPLLQPHQLALEVVTPYRWYLEVESGALPITTPLDAVAGQDVLPFMPVTDERLNLVQLMNDIQMMLHQSPINAQRERDGERPVNSVWFWGGGELPVIYERHWSFVVGDNILAKGLALLTATRYRPLPDGFAELDWPEGDGLIVLDACQPYCDYHDTDGWRAHLAHYETDWFAPLVRALKHRRLDQLRLETTTAAITVDKLSRYKLWKKLRPLSVHKGELQ